MPIVFRTNEAKYKSEATGEYVGFNVIGEVTTDELVAEINEAGETQVDNVEAAGATQVAAVNTAGATQLSTVNTAGETQLNAVNTAGATQVGNVNTAGTTQVNAVNQEGTTQVGLVSAEGATQVQAVEDKGAEVLESIPDDYEEKMDQVNDYLENLVVVSDTQPESESNKLWFDDQAEEEIEVPLYTEFEDVADAVDDLKNSLNLTTTYKTVSGDVATFDDGADNRRIRKIVGTIVPQQAAGTPSPENRLPISGWNEAVIGIAESKIVPDDFAVYQGTITTAGATQSNNYRLRSGPVEIVGGKTYTVYSNLPYIALRLYSGTTTSSIIPAADYNTAFQATPFTFTANQDAIIVRFVFTLDTSTQVLITPADFAYLNIFESGKGTQLPINWQTEAGTIYGGTVTLNEDGSADVVVDSQYITLDGSYVPQGSYAVNANTVSRYFAINPTFPALYPQIVSEYKMCAGDKFNLVYQSVWGESAESYAWCWTLNANNQLHLAFGNTALGITPESSSAEVDVAIQAWLNNNPCHFVLPIKESGYQTYHFDNVGSLHSFLGANNVWIDSGSITELVYNAGSNVAFTDEVNDSTTGLATKAPAIVNTVSGNVVSISDGAEGMPVKKIVGTIEPVQDLHGYANPWPAGGGTNKWDEEWELGGIDDSTGESNVSTNSQFRSKNYIPCAPSTDYFAYYNGGSGGGLYVYFYDINKVFIGRATRQGGSANNIANYVFTTTENAAFMMLKCQPLGSEPVANNKTVSINYPATTTTYSPYENICPISGFTGVNITRSGKNLFNKNDLIPGCFFNRTGIRVPNGSMSVAYIKVNPGDKLVYSGLRGGNGNPCGIQYFDKSKRFLALNTPDTQQNGTIATVPSGAEYIGITVFSSSNASYYDVDTAQLELCTTATGYEEYHGNTLPISWESEAGTIYGGTVTLNEDRSVDVVQTHGHKVLTGDASENWQSADNGGSFVYSITDMKNTTIPPLSNRFVLQNPWNASFNVRVTVSKTPVTTIPEWRNWLAENNLQVVYQLADPLTYHLDNVGQLRTFFGTNNIWTDCGSISELDYVVDTKTYVDKNGGPVDDVQINGTSILSNGVANIPFATELNAGAIKVYADGGTYIDNVGRLCVHGASEAQIKGGASFKPIVASRQHNATFYGLAKAAGDTTQSESSNAVGVYTEEAKSKIRSMLGTFGGYELLADVTIESDVTHPNGLEVYLSRPTTQFFIYAVLEATTGSTTLVLTARNSLDEPVISQTWPTAIGTTKKTLLLEESIFSDGLILTNYNMDNSSSQIRRNVGWSRQVSDKIITSMRFSPYTSDGAIATGSVIKVYGK